MKIVTTAFIFAGLAAFWFAIDFTMDQMFAAAEVMHLAQR